MRHIESIDRICACSCLFTTSHNQRFMFWTTYAPPRLQGPASRIPKQVLEWIVKILTSSERTAAWRGFQPASRAYGYTLGMFPTRPWAAPRKFEPALITLSAPGRFWRKPGCQAESCPNPAAPNPPRPGPARPAHVAASTHPEPAQTPPRSLWAPPSSPSGPAAPPSTPTRQGARWRAPSRPALPRLAEQAHARRHTIRPSSPPRHPRARARRLSKDFCSTRHRAGTWPRHLGAGQESPRTFSGHFGTFF